MATALLRHRAADGPGRRRRTAWPCAARPAPASTRRGRRPRSRGPQLPARAAGRLHAGRRGRRRRGREPRLGSGQQGALRRPGHAVPPRGAGLGTGLAGAGPAAGSGWRTAGGGVARRAAAGRAGAAAACSRRACFWIFMPCGLLWSALAGGIAQPAGRCEGGWRWRCSRCPAPAVCWRSGRAAGRPAPGRQAGRKDRGTRAAGLLLVAGGGVGAVDGPGGPHRVWCGLA